nr:MAG: hypothetical protein [Bacteriophage sp.]
MNNELTDIIYSIMGSNYTITKIKLCKAICIVWPGEDYPKCENINCSICPIFTSRSDVNDYPYLIVRTRKLLNES